MLRNKMSNVEKDNIKDALKKIEARRVATVKQIDVLIDFLHDNEELRFGRVRSREAVHMTRQLWDVCTEKLNKLGPSRNSKEWAKYWSDLKCRVKQKAVEISKRTTGTGEGCSTGPGLGLTHAETRIIKLIEHDRHTKRTHDVPLDRSGGSNLESMNYTLVKEETDEEMHYQDQEMNVEDFISTAPIVEEIAPPVADNQSQPGSVSQSEPQPSFSQPATSTILHHQPPPAIGTEPNMQLSPINRGPPLNRAQSVPPGESLTPKRRRRRPRVLQPRLGRQCTDVQCTNCTELKEFANIMLKLEESHARTTRLQTEASLKMTEVLKLQAEGIMHTGVALREMANNLCRLLEGQILSRDR